MVVVPPKGAGIKPDDPAFPSLIAKNFNKVLADAATHDPKKKDFVFMAGFNLFADLDIKGS